MSSIIQGYEYDIFISYRQKDNKYDGWVTEFVDNLKLELEATFKEEVSVYFDFNPQDGLLETHDVDASLKEKLKCLVFIPILSRTYCDSKSFAWEHEFKAFVEQASYENFGLKVTLRNGNVANRVLPVRIHELNTTDLRLCEGMLEGVLRSVDFIYKSAGVNRPLRANEDHPHDNLNKIYYRDQINKTANAIDEIINSLKRLQNLSVNENWVLKEFPGQNNITFADAESHNIKGIQCQSKTPGTILKNRTGRIFNYPEYWTKSFPRYFFSILFTGIMIFLALTWKGHLKNSGIGRVKREAAKTHVENAVKYFNNQDYAAAKAELDLAMKSDGKYSYAWSTLAAVSVKQGNLNDAILQTIEAVKFDPTNPHAAYNMAIALEDKKDYHQAIEWYTKAIKIDSTLVPAYSALGRLYNILNQPVDAILILGQTVEKYPESDYMYLIYKNLGNSHLLMNQVDEAIKSLERSREIKPTEPETNLYLAKAYEAAGKMSRSIDLWQNYIELETDSLKIATAKQHLKEITIKHLQDIIK